MKIPSESYSAINIVEQTTYAWIQFLSLLSEKANIEQRQQKQRAGNQKRVIPESDSTAVVAAATVTAAATPIAATAGTALITATMLIVAAAPDDLAWACIVVEVDVTELWVAGLDRHSAHRLSGTRLIVILAPVVGTIVPPVSNLWDSTRKDLPLNGKHLLALEGFTSLFRKPSLSICELCFWISRRFCNL